MSKDFIIIEKKIVQSNERCDYESLVITATHTPTNTMQRYQTVLEEPYSQKELNLIEKTCIWMAVKELLKTVYI